MVPLFIGIAVSLSCIYVNAELNEHRNMYIEDEHFRVRRGKETELLKVGEAALTVAKQTLMPKSPTTASQLARSASRSTMRQSSGAIPAVRNIPRNARPANLTRIDPYTNMQLSQPLREAMSNPANVRDSVKFAGKIQTAGALAFGGVVVTEAGLALNDGQKKQKKDIEDNHIKDNHVKNNHIEDQVDDALD